MNSGLRRAFSICLVIVTLFASVPAAFALDLSEAKSRGQVGEQADGLVGIVAPPGSAEVQALVREVNDGRMVSYRDIAAKQGASIDSVKTLAGKTLIEKTPAGQYVLSPSGVWAKK